jgi:ABC-type multidrug transport system fused ATPase/permease subunit
MNCALLAVLYHGSTLVLDGSMTPGALTSFLLYSLYVGFAFSGVSSFYSEFMRALGSSQRVFELLDREPDSTQTGAIKPENIQGHIEFKDVTFAYPSRPDEVILKNLNLRHG